jgi:hypothetical protein
MIVRCIANTGEALPAMSRDSGRGIDADTEFPVTLGRLYAVFAMTIFLGIAWYYILDDDGNAWPMWAPSTLFEVEDGSIPMSWQVGYFRFSREDQYPILSFPEWAADYQFYERLVAGDYETVRIFEQRRREVEGPGT